MPAGRTSSIPIFLGRVFAPREIYVSWGDRFRYLRVSARTQKIAAGGAALVMVWSLLATTANILDRRDLASKRTEIARQERAYEGIQRDLVQAFDNRAKLERRVLAQQAKLKVQVEALRTALEQEKTGRFALRDQRNTLSRRIEALKTRTSKSRATERAVMARLSERIEEGAEAIEKTIAMTGLNVDALISGTAGPALGGVDNVLAGLGQGGPYIPAEVLSAAIQPDSELAATASRLEVQLDRWSQLREVVRRLPLGLPLDQFRISSAYGQRRDPMTGRKARHPGIDFAAPGGTPIYATSPGIVVSAGRNGGYGYMVVIDHGYGIRTRYAHMRKILVEEGQEIGYRRKIGLVGSSGRSTGPHLHYEVRLQAQTRNPMKYILAGKYLFKD